MKNIYTRLIKILGLILLALLPLAVQASANDFTYYVNDAVGSPVVAMNQAGDVIWRKIYQPYGKASGKDGDNRIGYTGHVEDKPDLVYAGARYYDPDLMRFLSDDPTRFTEKNSMSFNRYAYANNNPYKFVDPDGRDPIVSGFSYSSGYLPHYGSDQETVDKMTTGISLVAVALAIPTVGAVLVAEETSLLVSGGGLAKSAEKGIRSLEKRIVEHEKKLSDFKENPTVRPGMEGQPESIIKAAQESRIRHLEKEIETFRSNIEKIINK